MKKIFVIGGLAGGMALGGLSGCTKVIDLSVPNASAQLVIQGNVTNAPGPYQVMINSTVAFTADNSFPAVDGAAVTITDGLGLYNFTGRDVIGGLYDAGELARPAGQYLYFACDV